MAAGAMAEITDVELEGQKRKRSTDVESLKSATVADTSSLTKTQRKRLKRKKLKEEKLLLKAKRPKREEQEPPISSKIILPKPKGYVPSFDNDEQKLAAAKLRLAEQYTNVLKIQPIPRPCPPGLLKDLCPLAISIRIPTKNGTGYAFLQFRNQVEMESAQKLLSTKTLGNKTLKVTVASSACRPGTEDWREPGDRNMTDFDWNTLFVTRLPRATTRLDLGQVFRKARSIRLNVYDDGSCKGTCTLNYKSPLDALQAFETRHGTFIRGSPIYVNFALKTKKRDPPSCSVAMETEDPVSSETINNEASGKVIGKSSEGMLSDEFVIDRQPNLIRQKSSDICKPPRKTEKTATNRRDSAHPKLISKHQLKRKGTVASSGSAASALEVLLRPPASKPKSAKKSKKLTKRGKPSKHR